MGDGCALFLLFLFFFFFFSFVQYTGRLLSGRREIRSRTLVPSFHFIFPVHGQEVPLLVLSESQKHFVYLGMTDRSLASLASKCRVGSFFVLDLRVECI